MRAAHADALFAVNLLPGSTNDIFIIDVLMLFLLHIRDSYMLIYTLFVISCCFCSGHVDAAFTVRVFMLSLS